MKKKNNTKKVLVKESDSRDPITKRLDALLFIFTKQYMKSEKKSTREVISELSSTGLKYVDIANILGRSSSYIASELTVLKKSSKSTNKGVNND